MHDDLHTDAAALLGGTGAASRRKALGLMLGAGYAAAAAPLMAQTAIATSPDGLEVGEVSYPSGDFQVHAYRAAPKGGSGLPVILVISEIFGVHEYIADVCRRLAHAGYLAIAPDLFERQGDPMAYGELAKLMSEVVAKVPDAQVMQDLDASVAWAGKHGGDAARVGITGFCWGGRITWLYAAHAPVKAAVAWYGRLTGQDTPLQPKQPLALAAQVKAPVLGLYGGKDESIPESTIEQMKAGLAKAGAPANASRFVVYPDAPHAFHADYRASYRKDAAEDGWKRTLAWFAQHGLK
ncbi:dienelactone hydrolase family protein [Comamonas sp. NLF-1-9]|uniref:dienelactone hydrolase family protein n=1 Tax=Comamonas sp. NLF-1-9 TaxID=2853163 RepID=UPI001C456595|nr:dienelactone hydrolase family protein [Comamonas sp. NLF-1-9]QXL85756.1 dienelactone hydrolase family protein [Comamonas sp. NLF-1-9]